MRNLFGSTRRKKTRVVEPPLEYFLDYSIDTPSTAAPAGKELLYQPVELRMPKPQHSIPPTRALLREMELEKTQVESDWDYQEAYTPSDIANINKTMEKLHTELKKLALKEDLLDLKRDIKQLQEQRAIDRKEQLAQVHYHQLQEEEILKHIYMLKDTLQQFIRATRKVPHWTLDDRHDLLAYPCFYDNNEYMFAK